jgi:hypothetical protein
VFSLESNVDVCRLIRLLLVLEAAAFGAPQPAVTYKNPTLSKAKIIYKLRPATKNRSQHTVTTTFAAAMQMCNISSLPGTCKIEAA